MAQIQSRSAKDRAAAQSVCAPSHVSARASSVERLARGQEDEVLSFLAARPLHTVIMSGLIRDNGLESTSNRGSFFACRDQRGRLVGVALVGHLTLVESRCDEALAALARFARAASCTRIIIGEHEKVEHFWTHYAAGDAIPYRACRELLFELREPTEAFEPVAGLRLATLADAPQVTEVHAQMAYHESGVDPLKTDPEGFSLRTARRIERGRVWACVADGRLIFKADVISETPEVIYLEGFYVHPEARGKGYGLRCFSQLSNLLLRRTRSLCLLVNSDNTRAQSLYLRAGYKLHGLYDTIFLASTEVEI
ncbi:MAG: uncharacterized protein QOF61_3131 [Acidobacteriota bacterium]|nr:uncharacterized protein [Acidobacteriota bacterium]